MTERIIVAGAGGQGIMVLGKVLAEAALEQDKHVTWLPAYGAEVRGGTAHCMVIISDEEIASPYIDKADTLIIMNEPSWIKFGRRIKNGGVALLNTSLAKKDVVKQGKNQPQVLAFPFSDIAIKLGNLKIANMVALGCYLSRKKVISAQSIFRAIEKMAPKDKKGLIEINRKALSAGMELA